MQESSSQSKPSASLENSDQKSNPPLQRIILCSSSPTLSPTKEGVSVPPLLQDLFGIDYLPRIPLLEQDTESIQSELSLEGTLEEGEEVAEHDYPTPLSDDAIQASLERKKMRVSVGKLASRMANIRQRRKHHRRGQPIDCIEDSFTNEKKIDRPPRKSGHNINATWIQKQQARLEQHKSTLVSVQQETLAVEARAKSLSTHLQQVQQEVVELEKALSRSIIELQNDNRELRQTKKELKRLEVKGNRVRRELQETASTIRHGIPPLSRSAPPRSPLDDDAVLNSLLAMPKTQNLDALSTHSEPNLPKAKWASTTLHKVSSFIRIHDLDMRENSATNSSLSEGSLGTFVEDMFYIDKDVTTVLTSLAQFGFDLATDESDRFTPALNTEKLLTRNNNSEKAPDPSWPIQPWYSATGKDVLVWIGSVGHKGHGCELPVYKARGVICTAPRNVVELLMDSSRVGEYNKMSQGRNDILYIQKGIDTTADESDYGIPGEAKIVKSLNKPPLIRRKIEMLSIIYARRLEQQADGYLVVSRSVWEDSSATTPQSLEKDTVRSEILLGVNIFRPVVGPLGTQYCEMTTITHTHTSGVVPDALLRKMGPGQAAKFLEEIQAIFSKQGNTFAGAK